jgi:hypothetical protein
MPATLPLHQLRAPWHRGTRGTVCLLSSDWPLNCHVGQHGQTNVPAATRKQMHVCPADRGGQLMTIHSPFTFSAPRATRRMFPVEYQVTKARPSQLSRTYDNLANLSCTLNPATIIQPTCYLFASRISEHTLPASPTPTASHLVQL